MMLRIFSFLPFFIPFICWGATEVTNWRELREQVGLTHYVRQDPSLKIAILDNGFLGFAPNKDLLPQSAELITGVSPVPLEPSAHGLRMAQIVWALTGKHENGPHFYLVNARGYTNLKAAIQFVIEHKVQIVLYSQVWTFGSNFDGSGFINALITKAIRSGVIWINAAGNYRQRAFNGFVEAQKDARGWLWFGERDYLRFENQYDDNQVDITLSWSDFQEDEAYSTNKDLDLYIYDEKDRLIQASELVQTGQHPPEGGISNLSSHARETVALRQLPRGNYRIRILNRSKNFSSTDRFRIVIDDQKQGISFLDHTDGGEILPPADHPGVITVGDILSAKSSRGPTADQRDKPDVLLLDSRVSFSTGERNEGSSCAAAIFAGIVASLKAQYPQIGSKAIFQYLTQLREAFLVQYNYTYSDLESLNGKEPRSIPILNRFLPPGSVMMRSTIDHHFVVLTRDDPFLLAGPIKFNLERISPASKLFYSPSSDIWVRSESALNFESGGYRDELIEFRQMSRSQEYANLWETPLRCVDNVHCYYPLTLILKGRLLAF